MEILQFCLLHSDIVIHGRTPFFAINSNQFGKPSRFVDRENWNPLPSRKIFRGYVNELLNERLLTQIKTSDRRSKYYSITPLGICNLIQSELFHDGMKFPWPDRLNVIQILATFAAPNVKPYKSIIFEGRKFLSRENDLWEDLAKIQGISLRHEIIHVFTNFETMNNEIRYYVTNGFFTETRVILARCSFSTTKSIITELDKKSEAPYKDPNYNPLELDDEQFHHYFANLMILSLIYDYAMSDFNTEQILYEKKRKRQIHKKHLMMPEFIKQLNNYPPHFIEFLSLFSRQVFTIIENQHTFLGDFRKQFEYV